MIVTTTTHLEKPATAFYAWEDGSFISDLEKQLKKGTFLTVGTPCIHHSMEKIKGIGEETLQKFLEIADVLLVEADGSRRMPVKVPAKHEPVVPHQTEVTIAVLGYPAIGKRIDACAYRSEELAAFLGKKTEDHISLTDVKAIWEKEGGARKGMKGNMLFVLNQCPKGKIADLVEYFKERTEIYLCEKEETL